MSEIDRSIIRVKSMAVIRDRGRLLVCSFADPDDDREFYRLLGGSVEFGETAEEALHREIAEEVGTTLNLVRLLGVVENRFTFAAQPGHEIVFVFDCVLTDPAIYTEGWEGRILDITDSVAPIEWILESDVRSETVTLYPDILALLD